MALGKSVRELRRSMDSEELSRWLAYDQLDQVTDHVMLSARIMCVVANCWSKGKYTPEDFTGRLRRTRVMSTESMKAMFKAITAGREVKSSQR